jgi:hypothetical protein
MQKTQSLFDELGITYRGPADYCRPGQAETHCGPIIERMITDHGVPHARQVLQTFVETKGNADMMVRPIVLAVSDILLAHRRWREAGLAWLEAFDNIRLRDVWKTAKATRMKAKREVMTALLFVEIERHLGPAVPPKPQRTKREAPPTALQRRLPIVRANIKLGADLLMQGTTVTGSKGKKAIRQQLGIDCPKHAAECEAVAMVYAEREDILARAPWPVLVALSRAPADVRQDFEQRLLAGERVTAKHIRAARSFLSLGGPLLRERSALIAA